jgi:toxin ParE1/3/4
MNARVIRRPQAKRDIVEISVFLSERNLGAADRFLDAVRSAFQALAHMPEMGSPRTLRRPGLAGLRVWLVPGFPNYLIYYRPLEGGIEVIRVLHAARDVRRIFGP